MIGGHNKGNKVEMYDSNLEEWISLNDIKAYSDKHSCILLPKIQKSEHDRILVLSSLRYVLLDIIYWFTDVYYNSARLIFFQFYINGK